MSRITALGAIVAFLILAASCGDDAANPVALGAAKATRIEGLPVPRSAEPRTLPGEFLANMGRSGSTAAYFRVQATLSQVEEWYEEEIPRGADWRQWKFCDPQADNVEGEENLHEGLIFERQWIAENRFLTLSAREVGAILVEIVLLLRTEEPGTIAVC